MESRPQYIDTNHSSMQLRMASSDPRPPGPDRRTSQSDPRYMSPVLAMTGEATSSHLQSYYRSGSTSLFSPSPATANVRTIEPLNPAGSSGENWRDVFDDVDGFISSRLPVALSPNVQPVEPSGVYPPLPPPTVISLGNSRLRCALGECGLTFLTSHVHKHIGDHHQSVLAREGKTVCPIGFCRKAVTNFPRHFLEHYRVPLYKCSRCEFRSVRHGNVKRHAKTNSKYPICKVVSRGLDECLVGT
ncbi:hypothetical protein EDD85DRAFT_838278 [Armillaria nabsnona]|nr:hypothetical protein EDD85DRAFT_838278 [Armillaria nabsnona]